MHPLAQKHACVIQNRSIKACSQSARKRHSDWTGTAVRRIWTGRTEKRPVGARGGLRLSDEIHKNGSDGLPAVGHCDCLRPVALSSSRESHEQHVDGGESQMSADLDPRVDFEGRDASNAIGAAEIASCSPRCIHYFISRVVQYIRSPKFRSTCYQRHGSRRQPPFTPGSAADVAQPVHTLSRNCVNAHPWHPRIPPRRRLDHESIPFTPPSSRKRKSNELPHV